MSLVFFLSIFLVPVFIISFIVGTIDINAGMRRIFISVITSLAITLLYAFLGMTFLCMLGGALSMGRQTMDQCLNVNTYMYVLFIIIGPVLVVGLASMYLGVFTKSFFRRKTTKSTV